VLCGISPLSYWLVLPLEQRFPHPPLPQDVSGIIMLGGFEAAGVSRARRQLQLTEAAERLTEAIALAYSLPRSRVIFVGGDGTVAQSAGSAANSVAGYLKSVGIAASRITLESNSRTTYENAVELRRILRPGPRDRFILVSSAYHLPRAVGAFRSQGFRVIPWPVDFRTRGWRDLAFGFDAVAEGLARFDMAFREWLGLVVYWASGRSAELWPGPGR
jgi:uncharacterized SAM-binding protein YcdF (DUF218 family)